MSDARERASCEPAPRVAPAAAAAAAPVATPAARVLALQRAAGNRATARAVALSRTPKEVAVTRSDPPYRWTANFSADLTGSECVINIRAKIARDADVTEGEETAVKDQTRTEFTRIWDSKFVFVDEGWFWDDEYLVRVKIEYVDKDEHVVIALHKGSGHDNRRNWYVASSATDRAHELGHQLGLLDEYVDATAENRKDATKPGVFTDNSIMGNYPVEGVAKASAKLRHGQSIAKEVGRVHGKTLTTRMHVPSPAPAAGAKPAAPASPK
jgi:hypothetical protein